jgi:homoserine dehydrogenase
VASNKKANARDQRYYDDLRSLLERRGKTFKYETNVGAGLPLVDTLLQLHHSRDRITRIKGVFSGSMSFLFNTYSESNRAFTSVLNEAQLSGYTEPDPREDLNGRDVARKLLILARTVDVRAELSDVSIQNLIPLECQEDVPYAEFKKHFPVLDAHYGALKQKLAPDHVLRYVGDLTISDDGEATLSVALVEVPKASPLGGIQGSDSLFEIYTEGYGDHPMVIQGAGAGAEVTARGVYSDILRLG